MKKELKMQWMVDKLLSPNYEYRIHNTNKNFGHIVMPTGTGKSGVCIEDIIYRIRNHKDGTLIINISCPILKLTQQFMDDVIQVLKGIKIDTSEIGFFINSSDRGENYALNEIERDPNHFTNEFVLRHKTINIIASCNKSLYKFINKIEMLRNNINDLTIINYLDEAHLLHLKYDKADYNGNIVDSEERVDLKKLCQLSNAVYAISATPDAGMNTLLKTFDKPYNDRYILEESAKEAISKNEIIPPHLEIMKLPEDEINVERLFKVLEDSKKILPNIKHKILVTARSRGQLDDLYKGIKALNNPDIEVFAICSADETDKYNDYFVSDIREFSNKVENCTKDCFVIHVQMLIQGIDIKGLTDCVMATSTHGGVEDHRTIIQTIGRVLRCAKGERGLPIEERTKKFGGVWFIIPENDITKDTVGEETVTERHLRGLISRYYGFNSLIFEKNRNSARLGDSGINFVYNEVDKTYDSSIDPCSDEFYALAFKMSKEIEEKYGRFLKRKNINTSFLQESILKCRNDFMLEYNKDFTSDEWLSNKEVTDIVYSKLYNILKKEAGIPEDILRKVL